MDSSDDDLSIDETIGASEKQINEEYRIWKKNAPLLYDIFISHSFEWPSLTLQWFPDIETPEDKDFEIHRLLAGTHTADGVQNYVRILNVSIPKQETINDDLLERTKDDVNNNIKCDFGGYGGPEAKISVSQLIPHDGEVNRARYMPQKLDLIATKTLTGNVLLFDRTRYPSMPPTSTSSCLPTMKLLGHNKEGFGLSWSYCKAGQLLSSDDNGTVCHWDIQASPNGIELEATNKFLKHVGPVNDVCWHKRNENIFGSVGDDGYLGIWDLRDSQNNQPNKWIHAHKDEINTLDFNFFCDFLLCTGSNDSTVALWDLRAPNKPVHLLAGGHSSQILQVQWNPVEGHLLASGGTDRRVLVWDLTQAGAEIERDGMELMQIEDGDPGPPELLFSHAGHTATVSDISWNINVPYMISSTAEDNNVNIWQIASTLREPEFEPINESVAESVMKMIE